MEFYYIPSHSTMTHQSKQSLKVKTQKLKCAFSVNMISYKDGILLCDDEVDNKVKKYETLYQGRI